MGIRKFEFETAAEVDAFVQGLEYVNDSAITILDVSDSCVLIDDEDYAGDDTEEAP